MVSTAEHSSVTTASLSQSESKTSVETSFQAALEHARRLTQMYGVEATEVAVAWDVVEELAIAKRRSKTLLPPSNATAHYIQMHLNAAFTTFRSRDAGFTPLTTLSRKKGRAVLVEVSWLSNATLFAGRQATNPAATIAIASTTIIDVIDTKHCQV